MHEQFLAPFLRNLQQALNQTDQQTYDLERPTNQETESPAQQEAKGTPPGH